MASSGVFVTLYDEETPRLYLDRGVYGTLMRPVWDSGRIPRTHYPTLADYACVRGGTHVFFFRKRKITDGGQVVGATDHAAFCLNAPPTFSLLMRLRPLAARP